MIGGISIASILAWVLTAFFVVGGIVNWAAPAGIKKDYRRWGYPRWFHYVTAILEFSVSVLLFFPETRLWGAAMGAAVMAAALGTLVIHREYAHAIAPAIVLILVASTGWLAWEPIP